METWAIQPQGRRRMRYEINGEIVTFYFNDPKRHVERSRTTSFAGTGLSEQQITPMLDAIGLKYRGSALKSQSMVINQLGSFFAGFKAIGSPLPMTSQDWNVFILSYLQFYLTDTKYSQAKTSTRAGLWSTHTFGFLSCLKDAEVIPLDVVIPLINNKKIRSLATDQSILGQTRRRARDPTEPPQKLLVDISFGMTDVDYLDAIETKCRHLVDVVKSVSLTHWTELMQDIELGQRLAAQITNEEIDSAIEAQRYGEGLAIPGRSGRPFVKYASPFHPLGVPWALALVRHSLRTNNNIHCVTTEALRRSPFMNVEVFKGRNNAYPALDSLTSMSSTSWQHLPSYTRFYRFAGLLSPVDMAAACLVLTIEHPQFTSESLQNAKLLNVRGKPRLLLTDNKDSSIFYLDKPRAGRMQSAALSELAQKILLDIVRCTAAVRDVLKRAGDKTWRYLFLGVGLRASVPGVLVALDAEARVLTGDHRKSINMLRLYPALEHNGLGRGSFDYRRLRNTMGVITWFETGSVLEMSRKLGNTRKVALNNYLPRALLHVWNTRIIRRFQNTLIVLAAHDEPYLLDATDFASFADLQHFIAQLILEYPVKTNPLADEVQRRLGGASLTSTAPPASALGFLNIRLSPKSLAYLYAFRDLAKKSLSDEQQEKVDTLSGLSPRQFMDMAQLLKHAAENTELHPSLRERMDVPRLVETHGQALALKAKIQSQLAGLSVMREWESA